MNKLLAFVALGVALVGGAFAQTYSTSTNSGLFVARANLTSLTTNPGVNVNPNRPLNIFLRSNAAGGLSTTVVFELSDGTVLQTTAITPTTNVTSLTVAAPLYFEVVRVSPSAALPALNQISATVIQ